MDSMNMDDLPTGPPADARHEADSAEEHLLDAKRQVEVHEEALVTREGDAQQEQSNPSSGDLPMTEIHEEVPLIGEGVLQEEHCDPSSEDLTMTDPRLADPVDTRVIEESSNPSPAGVTAVVPFILPPPTTQPKKIPQSTLEPTCMNDDVVDNTMRDLDRFSPPPKELVLCPQPLAVREVIDLDSMPEDNNVHGWDSDPNEPDINVDEDPLPQRRKASRDCDGPLTLLLMLVLHRPPQIHEVRTRKAQAPQGRAGRALAGG